VPFAGREPELILLRELLSAKTALSARKLVLVEGEPGIGKSRLVDEFMRGAGSLALSGAAHEMEQGLPYQPLIEALRCLLSDPVWPALHAALQAQLPPVWLAEVARLLPELQPGVAPSSSGPDEPRLWEAVHQFLCAISRQHAITFFIDDLQWADASTLALLTYVTRRAKAESADILFLAAARPEVRARRWQLSFRPSPAKNVLSGCRWPGWLRTTSPIWPASGPPAGGRGSNRSPRWPIGCARPLRATPTSWWSFCAMPATRDCSVRRAGWTWRRWAAGRCCHRPFSA
jgi:hypothetical protein